jgi:hypothetical protein
MDMRTLSTAALQRLRERYGDGSPRITATEVETSATDEGSEQRPLFASWAQPGAPAPGEPLFASWSEASWAADAMVPQQPLVAPENAPTAPTNVRR